MKKINAREAKQNFGKLLDEARREPVAICKHGRIVAYMIAHEDVEDMLLGKKALKAAKDGFIGLKASAKFLGIKPHSKGEWKCDQ